MERIKNNPALPTALHSSTTAIQEAAAAAAKVHEQHLDPIKLQVHPCTIRLCRAAPRLLLTNLSNPGKSQSHEGQKGKEPLLHPTALGLCVSSLQLAARASHPQLLGLFYPEVSPCLVFKCHYTRSGSQHCEIRNVSSLRSCFIWSYQIYRLTIIF